MNLLAFGDLHFTMEGPRGRSEEYPIHILRKMTAMARLAHADKVDVVICTGDIFHRAEPTPRDITLLIKTLRAFPGGFIISVLGNHDTKKPGNMRGTAYETLVEAGVLLDLSDGNLPGDTWEHAVLTGAPFYPEEHMRREKVYERVATKKVFEVRITHGMLMPTPTDKPLFDQTYAESLVGDVELPNLLINGHNHIPFDAYYHPFYEGQARIVNLGSLARIHKAEDGARRCVRVRVEKGEKPRWWFRPVPIEGDVWREDTDLDVELDRASEQAQRDNDIQGLIEDMSSEEVMQCDPESLLKRLSGKWGRGAKAKAEEYLAQARSELGG